MEGPELLDENLFVDGVAAPPGPDMRGEGLDGDVVDKQGVGVGAGARAVGNELVELGVGDGVGIGEGPVDAVGEVDVEAVGVVGAVVVEGGVDEAVGGEGDEGDIVGLEAELAVLRWCS
jgi:hypothetical protein